jgi:hypothetical protein
LRSSSRLRSASSGAITTNFERSKPMWRSSSGSTPRPIEPKPIITIGPAKLRVQEGRVGWGGEAVHGRILRIRGEVRRRVRPARGSRR